MQVLEIIWTITHNTGLIMASVQRVVVTGIHCYYLPPALVVIADALSRMHRFLLIQHLIQFDDAQIGRGIQSLA